MDHNFNLNNLIFEGTKNVCIPTSTFKDTASQQHYDYFHHHDIGTRTKTQSTANFQNKCNRRSTFLLLSLAFSQYALHIRASDGRYAEWTRSLQLRVLIMWRSCSEAKNQLRHSRSISNPSIRSHDVYRDLLKFTSFIKDWKPPWLRQATALAVPVSFRTTTSEAHATRPQTHPSPT